MRSRSKSATRMQWPAVFSAKSTGQARQEQLLDRPGQVGVGKRAEAAAHREPPFVAVMV